MCPLAESVQHELLTIGSNNASDKRDGSPVPPVVVSDTHHGYGLKKQGPTKKKTVAEASAEFTRSWGFLPR